MITVRLLKEGFTIRQIHSSFAVSNKEINWQAIAKQKIKQTRDNRKNKQMDIVGVSNSWKDHIEYTKYDILSSIKLASSKHIGGKSKGSSPFIKSGDILPLGKSKLICKQR